MFTGFMMNAWTIATIVAAVAGVVGYFVVLRGAAFPAHAIPKGAFAGAAGASLLGISTLIGLAVFSGLGALGIGALGRRGRNDVATALTLVMMLALGAAFLSRTTQYEPEIYSLLFGEILGRQHQPDPPHRRPRRRLPRSGSCAVPAAHALLRRPPRSPRPGASAGTASRSAS